MLRALPADELMQFARERISSLGLWGPVVLGLLYVAATLLFVPGWILTLVAGAVYGLAAGTVIVSLASTTGAALAFLIARYVARDRVRRHVERSPKLAAVDEAIGEKGWRVVALLRLSPAIPFNLQNYLYGVTAIRFGPYVMASWLAMLPGTFLYVYLGSVGAAAAESDQESESWRWALRIVGLLATVAVTLYVARVAQRAIREKTTISEKAVESESAEERQETTAKWPAGALTTAAIGLAILALALWVNTR